MLNDPTLQLALCKIAAADAYGAEAEKGGIELDYREPLWIRGKDAKWIADNKVAEKTGKQYATGEEFYTAFKNVYLHDTKYAGRKRGVKAPHICKLIFVFVSISSEPLDFPPVYLISLEPIGIDDKAFAEKEIGMRLVAIEPRVLKVQWLG